ncbi:MAG: SRPBCC family protein [Hyphomicrobiaceae bacterium]
MEKTDQSVSGNDLGLTIVRVFDAPRELMFRMWSEKAHMTRWFGPDDSTIEDADMDFRVGGAWHSTLRSPSGNVHRMQGIYREIVANERIVFTHAWVQEEGGLGWETLVTVTFSDDGGKTKLTFQQGEFETMNARDMHVDGWTKTLNGLEAHLAKRD